MVKKRKKKEKERREQNSLRECDAMEKKKNPQVSLVSFSPPHPKIADVCV
jgi:hypothetical protein